MISSKEIVLDLKKDGEDMEKGIRNVYSNELKKNVCHKICDLKFSTSRTAEELQIPLKTVEKWITAYHKNPKVFDVPDDYQQRYHHLMRERYDSLSREDLIKTLKTKDSQISYLKSMLNAKKIQTEESFNA